MEHLIAKPEGFSPSDPSWHIGNYNLAYYCAHCGSELMCVFKYTEELYVSTYSEDIKHAKDTKKRKSLQKKRDAELRKNYNEHETTKAAALKAYSEAQELTLCPICGGQLYKKAGYFMPERVLYDKYNDFFCLSDEEKNHYRYYFRRVDEKLERMKSLRDKIELDEIQKRVEEFLSDNDLPVAIKFDTSIQVCDSPEKLKEYITMLFHLESNIYSLCRLLSELYYLEMNCKRNVVLETNEPIYLLNIELNELKESYAKALEELEKAKSFKPKVSVKYPDEPTAPILAEPGFFNKKKVLAENERLTQKYQADMEAYQQEVKLCDEKKANMMERERADFIKDAKGNADLQKAEMDKVASCLESTKKDMKDKIVPSQAVNELLKKTIEETEALLKKTLTTRNELYGYNIVFEKYRNVVALSSFCEYLMSGRCSSLTGSDGAYNIYENEIRLNQVISQLDVVISSLEEIKQNQYMMYSELQNIHSSLYTLNNTMNKALASVQNIEATTTTLNKHMEHISQNSDVIAYNTAVTAYYSKVNADLTNALGFMVAMG